VGEVGVYACVTSTLLHSQAGAPALCVTSGASVTAQHCDFTNNTVSAASFVDAAGAVYVSSATFAVSSGTFTQNSLDKGEGGGIHCRGSRLTVLQSTFRCVRVAILFDCLA
jgi:hypothetical protein